jgi:hypothetical protein
LRSQKTLLVFLYEYSKDTQQLTASDQNQPGGHAAQPCSYIYPIYSVVKNRRAFCLAAASLAAPWGALEQDAQGSTSAFRRGGTGAQP